MPLFYDALYRMLYRCAYPIMQCYWGLFRQATHGVQVVVWVGNRVLLIRNSYRTGYTFPGGHINPKETAIQAAVRELREETGIAVNCNQLQQSEYITYLRSGIVCSDTFYKCHLDNMPQVNIDNREVIESKFASIAESKLLRLQKSTQKYLSMCFQKNVHQNSF